jgi:hypothetical protein
MHRRMSHVHQRAQSCQDKLTGMLADWLFRKISKAVGTARERIEDPGLANSELKSIQTLIQELSLQIGSVVHVRRYE